MKKTFIPLFVGLLCWTGAQAAIINHAYDGSKTAAENGDALKTTISGASSGDVIKVQAGTYQGNFKFKDGVNVSGGWNEGFTAQTDYATILDANNSGRPVTSTGLTTLTVWSNFKLTNGNPGDGGGGAQLRANARLDHCLIEGNTSGGSNKAGGGVHLFNGGQIYNCIIKDNTATGDAGGVRISIYNYTSALDSKVINCLIVNNTATKRCGGIQAEVDADIIGNTIVGNDQNTADDNNASRCGLSLNKSSDISSGYYLANNIIWGNKHNGTVNSEQIYWISRYPAAQRINNAVYNQPTGTGSISLTADDPGFTDAANGDFSLVSTSILVDKGSNERSTVEYDIAGNARISGTTVDIGCYEYQYPVLADNYVHPDEDLQEAIDATPVGETVYVEAGTYYGNFTMKDGVNVSGGWDATFENQTDYATILDAQNSGRVVNQTANFANLTVWSNLTIQHGNLTTNVDTYGSGVFLRKNGQVKHCIIQDNTFTYTDANCQGGGVANNEVNENSDVLVDDCIIRRNQGTHGGGVRIVGTIQNSIIEENSTTNNAGGGVHLFNGGCMYNCIIRNNTAGTVSNADMGGVRMSGSPSGTLANCLIVGNHATKRIGGLSLESNTHTVFGNTIVNNSQASSTNPDWCGVRLNVGGPLQFCNNIVWGNKANNEVQASQILVSASYAAQANNFVNNALVWNGKLADGADFNVPSTIFLTADPFKDAANGDFTPTLASGLIDTGHGGYFHGTTDLAGNKRKQGTMDRGCYEQRVNGRRVEEGKFGTICLPYAVAEFENAKVYKVLSFATNEKNGLLLEEVDALVAGKPYFFFAESDTVSFAYTEQGDAAADDHENGLYGTISGTTVSGAGYYVLQENELRQTYNEATSEPIEVTVGANRAYLYITEVPDAPGTYSPSPRHRIISIYQEEQSTTAIDQVGVDNCNNAKIMRDGHIFILHNGKAYNALGQCVIIK